MREFQEDPEMLMDLMYRWDRHKRCPLPLSPSLVLSSPFTPWSSLCRVLLFPIFLWSGLFCFYLVPSLWLPCGSSLVLWSGFVYMQMQTVWVVCACVCVLECVCMREIKKRGENRETKRAYMCCMLILAFYLDLLSCHLHVSFIIHLSVWVLGPGHLVIFFLFFFFPCCTLCAVSFTQLPRITPLQGSPTHMAHCCTTHLVPRCFNLFVSVAPWLTCFINKFSQCFRFTPLLSGLQLFVYFGIRKTFCPNYRAPNNTDRHAYFCFDARVFILDFHIHTQIQRYTFWMWWIILKVIHLMIFNLKQFHEMWKKVKPWYFSA